MAATAYYAKGLTGGGADDLDFIDGTALADGDFAFVHDGTASYFYWLDDDSAAAESSPDVIQPDANGGNKRWILQKIGHDTLLHVKDEDTMSSDSAVFTCTQQSIKAYVDTQMNNAMTGMNVRSKFRWKDADEIYIGAGVYDHEGTVHQTVYWDSELTYTLTSLANSDWSYVYIDDSAVVTLGSNLLTTTQIIDSITEPTFSVTKKGWYNGLDKCIFGVYTDGSANALEFFHEGSTVYFADQLSTQAGVDIDTAWTDIGALAIPIFTTLGIVRFVNGAAIGFFWRTNGQTGTVGHIAVGTSHTTAYHTVPVITDSAGIIEIKADASNAATIACHTEGWKFPITV